MCYHEDIEILCYDKDTKQEYYKKVKNIKKGEYVKSYGTKNQYSKVIFVGCVYSVNDYKNIHIIKNMQKHFYQNKTHKNIILTGYHSLLFKDPEEEQIKLTRQHYDKSNYQKRKIDECLKCIVGFMPQDFHIYHYDSQVNKIHLLTIESENPALSYGLYTVNNILIESCGENTTKLRVGENRFNKD